LKQLGNDKPKAIVEIETLVWRTIVKISLGGISCTDALKNLLDSLPRSHIYDITADCTVRTWFKPDPATTATNSFTTSPSANATGSSPFTRSQCAREEDEADNTHNRNQTATYSNYQSSSTAPTGDNIYNIDITTSRLISPQTTKTSNRPDTGNDLVRESYVATTPTFLPWHNDEVDCTERSHLCYNKTNGIFGGAPSEDFGNDEDRSVKKTRYSILSSTPITSMTSTGLKTTNKARYSPLHGRFTESEMRVIPENGRHSAQDQQPRVSSNKSCPRSDFLNISDEPSDARTRSPATRAREFESSSSFQPRRQTY
jgi:hypothetical protein